MNQPSPNSLRRLVIVGILAGCLTIGCLLALWLATRPPSPAATEVAAPVDVPAIKAKAEHGDPEAQKQMGELCAKGQFGKSSYVEAAKWYRTAADQGHAGAQAALGELYEAGQGVSRDEAEAAKWYRQAAEKGNVVGQYSLAVLCVLGRGVPKDVTEAVKWYRRAAEQGNAMAQYSLGMRYKDGDGVSQDLVEAYAWLSLASAQGVGDAVKARDELKGGLTRAQVEESQRRAQSLSHPKSQAAGAPR
jgi:uncharacterized protein